MPRAIFTKHCKKERKQLYERPDSFQKFDKAEVKQKTKQILSEISSNQGLNLNCTLKVDDFDSCENGSKFVEECDGYSYK